MLIHVQTFFRRGDQNQVTVVANGRGVRWLDCLGMILERARGFIFHYTPMPFAFCTICINKILKRLTFKIDKLQLNNCAKITKETMT